AQPLFVLGCKATEVCTVDIQNANNLIFYHQRQYDFRIAGGIARNVSIKGVNIFYTLNLVCGNRSTTHAATYRNTHAGNFPLEWPEHQCVTFEKVKTSPVHTGETFKQYCTRICQGG